MLRAQDAAQENRAPAQSLLGIGQIGHDNRDRPEYTVAAFQGGLMQRSSGPVRQSTVPIQSIGSSAGMQLRQLWPY